MYGYYPGHGNNNIYGLPRDTQPNNHYVQQHNSLYQTLNIVCVDSRPYRVPDNFNIDSGYYPPKQSCPKSGVCTITQSNMGRNRYY